MKKVGQLSNRNSEVETAKDLRALFREVIAEVRNANGASLNFAPKYAK
jgi:hypothetical protein